MFVSVIIPAHQLNEYLIKCLKTIENQNYPHYEVIVVSDNSVEVIDYVGKKYPHFNVLNTLYEGNGVSKARNLGADNAKGELLIFIDSDCTTPYNLIQTYVENYVKNHLLIGGIVGCDTTGEKIICEDMRDIFLLDRNSNESIINRWWFSDISWPLHHTLNFYTANVGLDRNDFLEGFRFNENLLGFEDIYYAIEHYSLYENIKYIDTFVKHLEPVNNWRVDKSQYNYKIFKKMVEDNYPQMLNCEHYNIMIDMLEKGINL